jgi:hypothetical protein
MSASEPSFRPAVDPAWSPEQSIVLRYREAVRFFDDEGKNRRLRDLLQKASIREGVRLSRWTTESDVQLGVLDETSLMHTGSMKAVDGCFTTAMCLLEGHGRVVFESGGNTGRALTAYLERAGVETFLFVPAENLTSSTATRSVVDGPPDRRPRRQGSGPRGSSHVWRDFRNPRRRDGATRAEFRGYAVLEHIVEEGGLIDRARSARFGPIGICQHPAASFPRGRSRRAGVQQEENCPVYRAWRYGDGYRDAAVVRSTSGLLNKVMYDSAPQTYGSLGALRELLAASAGRVTTVSRAEIDAFVAEGGSSLSRLLAAGFDVDPRAGQPAALMTLAGVLKEIGGAIAPGSRVLCLLTGGAARRSEPPEPGFFRRLTVERTAR